MNPEFERFAKETQTSVFGRDSRTSSSTADYRDCSRGSCFFWGGGIDQETKIHSLALSHPTDPSS
jgi:hypothetical protein